MPNFLGQMRCSCGGTIFSRGDIVVTDPGKTHETGFKYLRCLTCLRDLIHDRDNDSLKSITREDGKEKLREVEREVRENVSSSGKVEEEKDVSIQEKLENIGNEL